MFIRERGSGNWGGSDTPSMGPQIYDNGLAWCKRSALCTRLSLNRYKLMVRGWVGGGAAHVCMARAATVQAWGTMQGIKGHAQAKMQATSVMELHTTSHMISYTIQHMISYCISRVVFDIVYTYDIV